MSRNYRVIVARGSSMFLKQILAREAKEGKYAIFKNIKCPRSNYQTDISRHKHSIVFIADYQISFRALVQKSFWILFNFFRQKPLKSSVKFGKENRQKFT